MQQLKRLLIPERAEVIFTLALSVLTLGILNIKRFWLILDGNTAVTASNQIGLDSFFSNGLTQLDHYINPNWLDLLLWLFIGCIGFLIFSIITATIKTAKQEAELLYYFTNPRGRRRETIVFISKIALRLASLAAGIIWLVIFFRWVTPFCVKLFFTSLATMTDYQSWLWVILTVLIMAVSLYVFAILSRLVALKTRLF